MQAADKRGTRKGVPRQTEQAAALVLVGLEGVEGGAALRALPRIGELGEGGAFVDAEVRIALARIVDVSADRAFIKLHHVSFGWG